MATPHGLRDLSSLPGSEPAPLAVKALSPNHWTTGEFPPRVYLGQEGGTLPPTLVTVSLWPPPLSGAALMLLSGGAGVRPSQGRMGALASLPSSLMALEKLLSLIEVQFCHL